MSGITLYGPDGRALETAALTEEQYTRARFGLPSVTARMPDPDPIFRKTGLDYWMARELTADGHLYSAIIQREAALSKLEYRVQPGGKISGAKDKLAAEFFADCLENISGGEGLDVTSLIKLLGKSPLYGFQAVEIMWEMDSREWRPARYTDKPHEWYGWDEATRGFRFYPLGNIAGEPVPPAKVLLPRHRPDWYSPMGEKTLSRCFWPVTFKKGGVRFWAQLLERFGQPWLIANGNPGDADDLIAALERMTQNAIAVLPQAAQVEIKEVAKGRGEDYELFAKRWDAEISKVIVGQTLTAQVDGKGSYAASQTHNEVREDIAEGDAKIVAAALNTLAGWCTTFNYGTDAAPPRVVFFGEDDPNGELMARDKGFVDFGWRPAKEYLEKTYNVQLEPFVGDIRRAASPATPTANTLMNSIQPESGEAEAEAVADEAAAQAETPVKRLIDAIAARIDTAADYDEVKLALREMAQETPTAALDLSVIIGDAQVLARGIGYAEVMAGDSALANALLNAAPETAVKYGSLTPDEAVAYLKSKGMALSWNWREVWHEEHALSFTVAKAMNIDILRDIRDAVQQALDNGWTLAQFKKELTPKLREAGWWGKQTVVNPDGAKETVQLGSPRRLETIFRVNMQAAYQAGRWKGFVANKAARPYLFYSAVLDRRTRPAHRLLHGTVWNIDDPMLQSIYPPNDWRCRCTMRSLSADDLAASGKQVSTQLPLDIETGQPYSLDKICPPEWRYNVGVAAQRAEMLQKTLKTKTDDLMEGL